MPSEGCVCGWSHAAVLRDLRLSAVASAKADFFESFVFGEYRTENVGAVLRSITQCLAASVRLGFVGAGRVGRSVLRLVGRTSYDQPGEVTCLVTPQKAPTPWSA